MKKIISIIFSLTFLTIPVLNAQEKLVHGIITTFDSIPVEGAKISVQSTNQEVRSDSSGGFAVLCDARDVFFVNANGFNQQKIRLKANTRYVAVNLKLKKGINNRFLEIGYGHVSNENKSYSVENLNTDDAKFSNYASVADLIEGRFGGVDVSENGEVFIRGRTSFSANSALIVVDGVIVDDTFLKELSPAFVKNINIIKDAGASVYGARGGNGVVIVESK